MTSAARLPVAVDAMGGDRAPAAVVAGALLAAERGIASLLVGDQAQVEPLLAAHTGAPAPVTVVHAPEFIAMDESPGVALRKKPKASIWVATQLVKTGQACAVVSAGNSGAAMGAAVITLETAGVPRPAIATVLPTKRGRMVLLDVGANVDCTAALLVAFAWMGAAYAHRGLGITNPRVAVLSIGTEVGKGNKLTKQVSDALRQTSLNFVGSVEGNGLFEGDADVVVCDGFVGNVVLKVGEAVWEWMASVMRELMTRDGELSPETKALMKRSLGIGDYEEHGGALLLGVNGVAVIAHGRSTPQAIAQAIVLAAGAAESGVVDEIADHFRAVTA